MTTPPLQFAYDTRAVRVVFGAGAVRRLAEELDREGLRRVFLLTTPGRVRQMDAVMLALGERLGGTFAGAREHVPGEVVQAARDIGDRLNPDACLAIGGGSAIGLGKALVQKSGLPLIAVPTTYSGSEMTSIWGVTVGATKRTGREPRVAPRLVVYDPETTYDLPVDVSVASAMNALAHCVEAAWAPDASPVSDLLAWDGIRRIADALPEVIRTPREPQFRADLMMGAHLAGRALDMTTMGLHHKLCHVIGGHFALPHADLHAALLPCVAAFNAPAAPEAMVRIAAGLRADDAVIGLAELARATGAPRLRDLAFKPEWIPQVAALVAAERFPNPRPVDEGAVRGILEDALAV